MTVHFENVGRRKMTWSAEVSSLSDDSLIRAIEDKRALMSEGIEFDWKDGTQGRIVVGGFRTVGTFRVEGGFRV